MTHAAPTSRRALLAGLVGCSLALTACTPASTAEQRSLGRVGATAALLLTDDAQSPGTTPLAQLFTERLGAASIVVQPQIASSADDQLGQLNRLGSVGLLLVQAFPDPRIGDRLAELTKAGTVVVSVLNRPTDPGQVSLFVGWDDFSAGEQQFATLLAALQTERPGQSYNLEHVGSDPRNRSDYYRFRGTVLAWKPYRKDGSIAIKTGQISWSQVSTKNDDQQVLAKRLRTSLQATFPRWPLDGVITGSPAEAQTVLTVVAEAGKAQPMVITDGLSAEVASQIAAGQLLGAVYRDPQVVVRAAVSAITELRAGREITVNPQASWRNGYDNLVHQLPAILVRPSVVTRANAAQTLVDNPTLLAAIQPS